MLHTLATNRGSTRRLDLFVLAIAAPALATSAFAASTRDVVDQIDEEMYRFNLEALLYTHPGDDRGFGPEHDLAQQNIFDSFESHGLDVSLHPFEALGETWYNVVAVKPGTVFPERQYIVGAHYDSAHNPGADDDGSGVAAVMEIAAVVSRYEFEATVIFIAFDREEQGLIGSTAYADEHSDDDIRGMVAMDMVAWNGGADEVIFRGRNESAPIKAALTQAVQEYGEGLTTEDHGRRDVSDHAPFEAWGFQAAQVREQLGNPNYHTQNDHVELPGYIDYEFAWKITRSVCGWLVDQAVLVEPCPADVDGDGTVDFSDLLDVLAAWGACEDCPEDVDEDGDVDFEDLLMLLGAWGPCA